MALEVDIMPNGQAQPHRAAELLITKRRLPGVGWSDLVICGDIGIILERTCQLRNEHRKKPGASCSWLVCIFCMGWPRANIPTTIGGTYNMGRETGLFYR